MAYEDVCSSKDLIYVREESRIRDYTRNDDVICGCLTHRQAGYLVGSLTTIYAILIIVHEAAIENGELDARNFVAIGISLSWIVTTCLLFLALVKRTGFLLTPWLIMTSLLTPFFLIAIVVGCRYIAICITSDKPTSCQQEEALFGTLDLTKAISKLALLVLILFSNMISLIVIYRVCVFLPVSTSVDLTVDNNSDLDIETPPTRRRLPSSYIRASHRSDPELLQPLCEVHDDEDT